MAAPPPPPPRSGMSLYANLLEPTNTDSASISRAPVRFNQSEDTAAAKKPLDSALRFQPIIRRPQPNKAVKPKPSFPKLGTSASASPTPATAPPAPPAPRKLEDWAATEEDEFIYGGPEKRQRGGRRAKKKKKHDERPAETDWDEIYDPSRPTNIEEYLRSDEKIREVQDWKAVLYAHRRKKRGSSEESDTSDEGERMGTNNQFAPPPSYASFPPPPPSAPPAPTIDPEAATGDDAYARRLALSSQPPTPPHPPPPSSSLPPQPEAGSISRAPVRYSPPRPPADAATEMDVDPSPDLPSSLPSRKGFAARIMSKYGWSAGTGLGASESGITSALSVQVSKRRRRPDAEGGGFAEPGGRGKIIAPKSLHGTKSGEDGAGAEEQGRFGKISQVIVLNGMLENMEDLSREVEDGLGQEIGEECGEKYGRVERVYIDVEGRKVFIKFTDGVSALRAVNALDGRVFNGNTIVPGFWDVDKFEKGVYE